MNLRFSKFFTSGCTLPPRPVMLSCVLASLALPSDVATIVCWWSTTCELSSRTAVAVFWLLPFAACTFTTGGCFDGSAFVLCFPFSLPTSTEAADVDAGMSRDLFSISPGLLLVSDVLGTTGAVNDSNVGSFWFEKEKIGFENCDEFVRLLVSMSKHCVSYSYLYIQSMHERIVPNWLVQPVIILLMIV